MLKFIKKKAVAKLIATAFLIRTLKNPFQFCPVPFRTLLQRNHHMLLPKKCMLIQPPNYEDHVSRNNLLKNLHNMRIRQFRTILCNQSRQVLRSTILNFSLQHNLIHWSLPPVFLYILVNSNDLPLNT